jgi:DNA-binding NarL/FixJ family response regulator
MSLRILIVDDHQMMCDGLRLVLEKCQGAEVVGTSGDSATAFRMTGELRPELVLMDVDLPDGSGIALTRRLRQAHPEVKILVLTGRLAPNLLAEVSVATSKPATQGHFKTSHPEGGLVIGLVRW